MSTQFEILRLGHLGDGIAEGPVYVPRTLPGEVVSGRPNGAQLLDIRVETPSPHRVQPPCRHYRACGGCQLQHADDGFVAGWKLDIVRAAMAAHGLSAPLRPIITSPARSRRRATFSARRTKKGALVGFHGRQSDVITEIPNCQLLDPELLSAIPVAEELARLGASRKGPLAVTVTLSEAGLDLAVTGGKTLDGPLESALAQVTDRFGLARLAWNQEQIAMRHLPSQVFGKAHVVPPPGAFLQATRAGEASLLSGVEEITAGARRIVDLFAGCGTFALSLAERAEIHAVEGERDMIRSLDAGWRQTQGLKKVTSEVRDLFRRPLMPDELNPFGAEFEAAVIDPPRAGAEAQIAHLARARTKAIAYVSCNPVTFARDAAVLVSAGHRLDWVQVVDQFRWSPHIELVASLTLPS